MSGDYFGRAREEIFSHVPADARRILELGCGSGGTLAALRESHEAGGELWLAGVELSEEAAGEARERLDKLWVGDVEALAFDQEIEAGSLDVILCLDVLEHLVDPWEMVRRLAPLLKPGGRLIASIPNVRHWKFIWGLLFRGDFHYRDAGLLDRTHLRFFVKQTAIELVTEGGLSLLTAQTTRPFKAWDARWVIMKLTGGRMEQLLTKQYLYVAESSSPGSAAKSRKPA